MYPRQFAQQTPERDALIFEPSGVRMTYAELESQANRVAQFLRSRDIRPGERVAFALENCPDIYPFVWGAQRAGLFYVAISSRLTADEIAYILADSDARLLLTSDEVISRAGAHSEEFTPTPVFTTGASTQGYRSWDEEIASFPDTPIADERPGIDMLYSSGTTGKPKGIMRALPAEDQLDGPNMLAMILNSLIGDTGADTVYLSPAPLYHAAPLSATMSVHRLGGTAIILEKFDPELTLRAIDAHKATSAQFVPTHFIRMLRLSDDVRSRYSHQSLVRVLHAAAPCPAPVKQAMIDWWGPIITEYYGGSEGVGLTVITASEWLERKGSVGKAAGCIIHICDEAGSELPPRFEGEVFFESDAVFSYHNDPAKTAAATHSAGWRTFGDIGWVDEEGYLYLTDRKSFMIISGGVNIYPQEIENLLATHPKVADVAVIGAPDPDMGEKVVAVVQPLNIGEAGKPLAAELDAFCRANLSGVKVPRQIDFVTELPRMPTGKLFKRLVRDAYWEKSTGAVAQVSHP